MTFDARKYMDELHNEHLDKFIRDVNLTLVRNDMMENDEFVSQLTQIVLTYSLQLSALMLDEYDKQQSKN